VLWAIMTSMTTAQARLRSRFNRRITVWVLTLLMFGAILIPWLMNTPPGLLGKADAIGYAVCHRIDLRSFHLGERALPLCVRCTGMYLGAMLTLGYYCLFRRRAGFYPQRALSIVLILFGLLWAFDGLNSYLNLFQEAPYLYPPSHVLRLVTGTLIGISIATLIYPMFSQTVWRTWRQEAVLRSGLDLFKLLTIAGLMVLVTLSENPLILYPLALISSFGVVILLTYLYTMVIISFLRHENRARSWRDLLLPFLVGLTIAILQIALIDLGRFWLTGTWDGFQI
jgi:uncharacterized membrane protein